MRVRCYWQHAGLPNRGRRIIPDHALSTYVSIVYRRGRCFFKAKRPVRFRLETLGCMERTQQESRAGERFFRFDALGPSGSEIPQQAEHQIDKIDREVGGRGMRLGTTLKNVTVSKEWDCPLPPGPAFAEATAGQARFAKAAAGLAGYAYRRSLTTIFLSPR